MEKTLTKADLVAEVAKNNGFTKKDAEEVVEMVLESIKEALASADFKERRTQDQSPTPERKKVLKFGVLRFKVNTQGGPAKRKS